MPECEYRLSPPGEPTSSQDICEILPELRRVTGRDWHVEEFIYIGFSNNGNWMFKRFSMQPIKRNFQYNLLLYLPKTGEYQIINGVSTEREVLAYCYGAIGNKR